MNSALCLSLSSTTVCLTRIEQVGDGGRTWNNPEQEKKRPNTNQRKTEWRLVKRKERPISIGAELLEFPFHCYLYLRPLNSKSRQNGSTAFVLDWISKRRKVETSNYQRRSRQLGNGGDRNSKAVSKKEKHTATITVASRQTAKRKP
jgi:hypothetical protein